MHVVTPLEFLLGLVLGYAGGLFGITGGVIAVPILGLLGFGQQVAQGTSLVMQLPTGILGLWHYRKRSALSVRLMGTLAIASGTTTYLGARLAIHLPTSPLRKGFAIFLVLLATFTIWNAYRRRSMKFELPWPYAAFIGAGGGFCSGFFGVGGATFTIPLLTLLFGVSQAQAQGLGLSVVLPAIVIAVPTYTLAGLADWSAGLALGVGAVCTVGFGVALAHRLPERVLRVALCLVLYAGASALWIHG
jgi:uncharacterized membrane protein YfcA